MLCILYLRYEFLIYKYIYRNYHDVLQHMHCETEIMDRG